MTGKRQPAQTNFDLMPLADDVDLIRFEKNLLQIGFFGANDARDKNRTSRRIEQIVFRNGHKVKVAAEFRGSEQLGLPSTTDRDKFIALLKIVSEARAKVGGPITNPVRFSGYRMIQELGLSRNGEIYEEILRWGKRMTDTTITSEQVVYFAAKKVYSDEILHVFRAFRRTGSSRLNGTEKQEHYEVILEDWLLENLNQRYVIPEDFNAYKQLTRPTAKGIFGNLHLWFYASQGRPVEKAYEELCNLLNVQAYPHVSKIRSTMGLALDELVSIRYLSGWDVHPMATQKSYKILLKPGEELLRILEQTMSADRHRPFPRANERLAGNLMLTGLESFAVPEDDQALKRLLEFGVLLRKARQLVDLYGQDRVIATIDALQVQLRPGRRSPVENPAGLIIYSLENGLKVPVAGAAESKEREGERRHKIAEGERRLELEIAYQDWLEVTREELLSTRYTPDELEKKLEQVVASYLKRDAAFARVPEAHRAIVARQVVLRELSEEQKLPGFDEWMQRQEQGSLFRDAAHTPDATDGHKKSSQGSRRIKMA